MTAKPQCRKGLRFGSVRIGIRPGTALVIDQEGDGEGGAARSNMCGCRPHDADSCVKRVRIPPKMAMKVVLGEGRQFSWLPNPHSG